MLNRCPERPLRACAAVLVAGLVLVVGAAVPLASAGTEGQGTPRAGAAEPTRAALARKRYRLKYCGTIRIFSEGVEVSTTLHARGVTCRFARRVGRGLRTGRYPSGWSCSGSEGVSFCAQGRATIDEVTEDPSVRPFRRYVQAVY